MSDMDYMGEVMSVALEFRDSGFNPDAELRDPLIDEVVPASKMFTEINGRWHLRAKSLPGFLSICAVAIDDEALILETAPLNSQLFSELVRKAGLSFYYDAEKGNILSQSGRVAMSVSKPETFDIGGLKLAPRCLCRVALEQLDVSFQLQTVRLIDRMFTEGVFVHEEEESASGSSPAVAPKIEMRMEMNMGLVQALELTQRPIMALKQEQKQQQEARRDQVMSQQQLQIQQLMTIQRQILNMTREELLIYTAQQVAERGELAVLRVFSFVLAGRVKRVRPALTWKQARRVADKLLAA